MKVVILCPAMVETGGPEALHQLSDALISQGVDAQMWYTMPGDLEQLRAVTRRDTQGLVIQVGARQGTVPQYAKYKIRLLETLTLDAQTVVVLPETYLDWEDCFRHQPCVAWWLSVDNAFKYMAPPFNLNRVRAGRFLHVYQSQYARNVLDALGIRGSLPLSDYTPILPASPRERSVISMSALPKVIVDVESIKQRIQDACGRDVVLIRNMSREQVYDAFDRSFAYIDLGHFPGKDRMPREALLRGCCVITSDAGAAGTGELMLPDECVFSLDMLGALPSVVKAMCQDFNQFSALCDPARQRILAEQLTFEKEVCAVSQRLRMMTGNLA